MGQPIIIPDESELGLQKQCPKCGEFWPLAPEFYARDKSNPDGYDTYCRSCKKQLRLEYDARQQLSFKDRRDADRRHRVQTKKRLANTIITKGEI